jgi:hypothetical protein
LGHEIRYNRFQSIPGDPLFGQYRLDTIHIVIDGTVTATLSFLFVTSGNQILFKICGNRTGGNILCG